MNMMTGLTSLRPPSVFSCCGRVFKSFSAPCLEGQAFQACPVIRFLSRRYNMICTPCESGAEGERGSTPGCCKNPALCGKNVVGQ